MPDLLDALDSGTGPDTVVLVHSSGMSAVQWLRHVAVLSRRHRVLAPNLLGYGKSPAWNPALGPAVDQDVAALTELGATLFGDVHLVGHSYGGALALRLARAHPGRFRSLTVFEPILFGVLDPTRDAEAFHTLERAGLERLAPGSPEWMVAFVELWSGPGNFHKMSAQLRDVFLAAAEKVAGEVQSLVADQTPPAAYRALTLPVTAAYGADTPLLGSAMTRHLAEALPNASLKVIAGAGHMAPVTRAKEACELIEARIAAS